MATYSFPEGKATMYGGFASVIMVNLLVIAFILQHYVGDFAAVFGKANWGGDPYRVVRATDEVKKEDKAEDIIGIDKKKTS